MARRAGAGRRVLAGVTLTQVHIRPITDGEEGLFLRGRRPDGAVFGLHSDADGISHIVLPTFVRGRDQGWFFAYCYRCNRDEQFMMAAQRYFDPFTGHVIASKFTDALTAGVLIRKEWMRRRTAMRQADALPRRPRP